MRIAWQRLSRSREETSHSFNSLQIHGVCRIANISYWPLYSCAHGASSTAREIRHLNSKRILVRNRALEASGEHGLDRGARVGQRRARDAAEALLHVRVHRVLGPADAGLDDHPVRLRHEVLQRARGRELRGVARRERGDGGVVELDDGLGDDVACGVRGWRLVG